MVSPANQSRLTQLAATKLGARLFRYSVGLAWIGDVLSKTSDRITLGDYRPFKAGVVGASDNIGFVPVTITADMVGSRVAVFLAIEDKQNSGRTSPEQRDFIAMVRRFGGRAGVSRGDEDTAAIVAGEIRD